MSPEIAGNPFIIIMVFVLGAAFGSLVSLLSYRLPREEPVGATHSRCPQCHHRLGVRDLVPMLSWLFSKGRCRYCTQPISWRYPAIELIAACIALACFAAFGISLDALIIFLLSICVLTLIVTDLEHYIIPDEVQVAMLMLGAAYGFHMHTEPADMVAGFAVGLTIGLALRYGFLYLREKDGLGLGDVKFLAVAGVWLGVEPLVPFLFFSGVIGVITAMLWRVLGLGERFPFGPALALAMMLCLLWPAIPDYFWNIGRLFT